MTIEFILPDIGEGIVECELLEWLVSEGEHIEEGQMKCQAGQFVSVI